MRIKRALYILGFLFIASTAGAQINIFVGGNLQGNYSWIRSEQTSFNPGFGAGLSFVYWEYEYWFIKAGVDYLYRSSSSYEYPDVFGDEDYGPDDKINVDFTENNIGIPISAYFRPYESGNNALILLATLEPLFAVSQKASNENYEERKIKGSEINPRIKTSIGVGAGWQRQLDRNTYLNLFPSFNFDISGERRFNSITLTAEILFGVY